MQDDSDEAQKYNEWGRAQNKAEVSHQLIAGAGAYEVGQTSERGFIPRPQVELGLSVLQAMKSYQEHCARNGKVSTWLIGWWSVGVSADADQVGVDLSAREP